MGKVLFSQLSVCQWRRVYPSSLVPGLWSQVLFWEGRYPLVSVSMSFLGVTPGLWSQVLSSGEGGSSQVLWQGYLPSSRKDMGPETRGTHSSSQDQDRDTPLPCPQPDTSWSGSSTGSMPLVFLRRTFLFFHYFNFNTNLLANIWSSKKLAMLLHPKPVQKIVGYLANDSIFHLLTGQ